MERASLRLSRIQAQLEQSDLVVGSANNNVTGLTTESKEKESGSNKKETKEKEYGLTKESKEKLSGSNNKVKENVSGYNKEVKEKESGSNKEAKEKGSGSNKESKEMGYDNEAKGKLSGSNNEVKEKESGSKEKGSKDPKEKGSKDPKEKKEEPDNLDLYSSRQVALFGNKTFSTLTKAPGIRIDEVEYHRISRLQDIFPNMQTYPNVFVRTREGPPPKSRYNKLINDDEVVLLDIIRKPGLKPTAEGFLRSGPRANLVWAPGEVKAAIVSCGGLCPGLNNVIADLVVSLYYNYGVDEIFGIMAGFRGFWHKDYRPWRRLFPKDVAHIHEQGGTILNSSRGGFDAGKIIDSCLEHAVNQVYIIGGDGTHRAANLLHEEVTRRKIKITVGGIPKTIDNDVGVIDRSFGFNTAVAQAREAIKSAVVEATCAPNAVGIVRLMGRHSGYIAAQATLSASLVDLCLIPEVEFSLPSVLSHLEKVLQRQGYAVMVVAEGAGSHLVKSQERDEGGNLKIPDIGLYLKEKIVEHFKKMEHEIYIKYHDPSYMIRSVPANADDAVYCSVIAQNAVHAAMAGFTGFTSGVVNNRSVLIPMSVITSTSPSYLNIKGRTWERVLATTHQPE